MHYYGWRVVIVAAAVYALVFGSTVASFSLYVVPVSTELGLSRAQMNTAFVLISVGNGVWAPFIGRSIDRFSLKLIIGLSAVLLAAGFVCLALSHWLWLNILALAVGIAIGIDGAAMLTLSVLVARWFRAHRARALTLSVTGQGLGTATVPLLTAVLIESFGWRAALFVTGCTLALILLLVAIFVRERPRPDELEPGIAAPPTLEDETAATGDERRLKVRALLGMPHFWLIATSIALTFTIPTAFGISIVPLGLDFGLSMTHAAALVTAYASAAVLSKFLLAGFADRIDRFTLLMGLLLVGIPLSAAFPIIHGQALLWVFVILFGLVLGGFAALYPILQVDVFGLPSYGTVRGLMIPIQSVFLALGARAAGEIYDLTGNYVGMFMTFAAVQVVTVVMLRTARSLHARACSKTKEPGHAGQPPGSTYAI